MAVPLILLTSVNFHTRFITPRRAQPSWPSYLSFLPQTRHCLSCCKDICARILYLSHGAHANARVLHVLAGTTMIMVTNLVPESDCPYCLWTRHRLPSRHRSRPVEVDLDDATTTTFSDHPSDRLHRPFTGVERRRELEDQCDAEPHG